MSNPSLFKWRHFQADIILCAVRWYLRYALSYRDVEELLRERAVSVDHTTIFRWVQRYAPELDKRLCSATNPSAWLWSVAATRSNNRQGKPLACG